MSDYSQVARLNFAATLRRRMQADGRIPHCIHGARLIGIQVAHEAFIFLHFSSSYGRLSRVLVLSCAQFARLPFSLDGTSIDDIVDDLARVVSSSSDRPPKSSAR